MHRPQHTDRLAPAVAFLLVFLLVAGDAVPAVAQLQS
jgi:hypothetical protein